MPEVSRRTLCNILSRAAGVFGHRTTSTAPVSTTSSSSSARSALSTLDQATLGRAQHAVAQPRQCSARYRPNFRSSKELSRMSSHCLRTVYYRLCLRFNTTRRRSFERQANIGEPRQLRRINSIKDSSRANATFRNFTENFHSTRRYERRSKERILKDFLLPHLVCNFKS